MIGPDFLTLADVIDIHADQIQRYGGNPSIRDLGLLDSAIAVAQSGFGSWYLHPTLYDMAAAYAYHISENQPFVDGNKRTGLAAALVFLKINSVVIEDPKERLYEAMLKVGKRHLTKEGLARILEDLHKKKKERYW